MLLDLFIPKERKSITAALAALGLALTLGFTLAQIGQERTGYQGMIVLDGFSIFVNALLLVSGLLGIGLFLWLYQTDERWSVANITRSCSSAFQV